MAAFLYHCPATGFHVQGWADDDEPEDDVAGPMKRVSGLKR
jgi:hypothetical protein